MLPDLDFVARLSFEVWRAYYAGFSIRELWALAKAEGVTTRDIQASHREKYRMVRRLAKRREYETKCAWSREISTGTCLVVDDFWQRVQTVAKK